MASSTVAFGSVGVRRRLADHAIGADEPRDIVHVPVGMVAFEAFVDPDDLSCVERGGESRFGLRLGPAIAVGVQQSLARGEECALAVVIDGATFEHEVERLGRRSGEACDVASDRVVAGEVELAAPAVGLEAERHMAIGPAREDGARVAQPDVPGISLARSRPRRRPLRGPRLRLRHR